jgi:integrase
MLTAQHWAVSGSGGRGFSQRRVWRMPFKDSTRNRWRGVVKQGDRRLFADFTTKKEAIEWEVKKRKELQEEMTRGPTPADMGLLDFCNKFLDYARLRFTSKTYDNKKRVCARLIAFLGDVTIGAVLPDQIQDYLSLQANKGSRARYNEDYKHLRSMWTWGREIMGLRSNPVASVKRLPQERRPQYTPTTEEVLKVLAAATPEERVFLRAYLQTGGRRSEIFRWIWHDDINFEKREVRLGTRKTRDGSMEYEWLPMTDELYDALWWWWKNRPVRDTPYVFVSTSNRHYGEPFTTRRQFMKGLCKRAEVPPFGFHALRRYVASVLADTHKVSAKTIQRILRHKAVTTTERYIHNINKDLAGTMNLLGEKVLHEGTPKGLTVVNNEG